MRKRKEEQAQLDNVQPVKKVKTATDKRNISQSSGTIDRFHKFCAQYDNPDNDFIPNSIPTLGS
eukprot:5234676-Heterocapsa_arctica.AAC.1